ncbi:MAG: hypothetical protein HKL81_08685 [Acidimicrobiaceae bacterium]|nr:hypothetical protein [Acidimicrobiaceae bacterium]
MIEEPFSEEIIEALLGGVSNVEALPPGLRRISELVSAANAPAAMTELAMEDTVMSAYRNAWATSDLGEIPERKRSMISKFLSAKVALAGLAIALTGGTAAALTGVLPVSFNKSTNPSVSLAPTSHQDSTNSQVGSDTKTTDGGSVAGDSTSSTALNQGLASGKSLWGLCNAYSHAFASTTTTGASGSLSATGDNPSTATAFVELGALAKSKGDTIAQLCATAVQPSMTSSNRPSGMGNSSGMSGNTSSGGSGQNSQIEFPPTSSRGMSQNAPGKSLMPSKSSRSSSAS